MPAFNGGNCQYKFVIFSVIMLIISAFIFYFVAQLGIQAIILVVVILSVIMRYVVDVLGDKMLTEKESYMSKSDIKEYGKTEIDSSVFKSKL